MKQLPQDLKDWLDLWVGADIPKSSVIPQFIEMQQRIDELEKENAELRAIIDKRFADGFKLRHTTRQLTGHIGLEAQDKREVLAQHDKEVKAKILVKVAEEIENEQRINSKSKPFAVAIILNAIQDLEQLQEQE